MNRLRPQAVRLLGFLVFAALLLAAPAAPASSTSSSGVVVSQVFAGGGNAGASFDHDFVELFNAGSAAVGLNGWTVQYASAASTSWQTTVLAGSVPSHGYFLVQLNSSAAVGAALPTPDAVGTSNLAVSGGKVALVTDSTALTCGASPGSCSSAASVADLVGYGSAADYEGSAAAPALSSSTAAVRAAAGCTDTDSSSGDFTAAAPTPRNTSTPVATCSGGSTPTGVSAGATVDVDVQAVLSLALERPTVSFGSAFSGDTPAPISERVTVSSSNAAGYVLSVHRSAFTPADLPLGLSSTAPAGTALGSSLAGGARAAIPISPASDLTIGTASAQSAAAGDVWPTSIGFTAPLPVVAPGHYSATLTYTLIGR